MGEPSTHNRSSMEKGPSPHRFYSIGSFTSDPECVVVKAKELSKALVWLPCRDEEKIPEFQVLRHGKAHVQATMVGDRPPNGASALEGDTSLMTGSGIVPIENGKPLLIEGNGPAVLNNPFVECARSLELLSRRYEEEMLEHMWRKFCGLEVPKPDKDLYSKTIVGDKHTPNGAFVLGGGTLSRIGTDLPELGKPQLVKGIHHHTINIPDPTEEDFLSGRFPNEVRGQNRGTVAILCAGVSAQTILGLVAGPGAISLPKSIFYCAAAANAIAFVSSSLALLLMKKKPHAAGILERVGLAFAIATFLLMMRAVMP